MIIVSLACKLLRGRFSYWVTMNMNQVTMTGNHTFAGERMRGRAGGASAP